ncbi:glycoside hydrolase family 13 protein [Cellulomonas sp. NPDC089187]|uniref:glycoside hydrolase family 13 protein n=1 Tax=Cellulomonas sp. NPDC089187 TaxID=3154970 RepID=UPI00341A4F20
MLQPHHDGSALYVPAGTPRLGDIVPVRLRVPGHAPESVWLRVVEDGEPRVYPARHDGQTHGEHWFTADLPMTNPVTQYRFLLVGPQYDGGQAWLNGEGLIARDVTDAADFRLSTTEPGPQWARDAVVYQVFPDRFARSAGADHRPTPDWALPAAWGDEPIGGGPGTGTQFYGGDLTGIEEHLDHLERLGVTTLYLTPSFPGRSNHRYDASTFDMIDPLLGGDEALVSLSAAVHRRGMRIVGDLTTNHTGAAHDWFLRAQAHPDAPERSFYYWTDTAPGYVGWLGHASLPKLNHNAPALTTRMAEVVTRYLADPMGLDGWRIDVANMTGRQGADDLTHQVSRELRATIEATRPDGVLIAEHFHDAGADLVAGGWHGTMNYSGFTRPIWSWLAGEAPGVRYVELPTPIPHRRGPEVVAAMRAFGAAVPWSVTTRQWNLLGSHDTARIRTILGGRAKVEVAAGLLFTYPGTPVVFAGDEGGAVGTNGEHARVTMPWEQIAAGDGPDWDGDTFALYQRLIALRAGHRALREGGLRWVLVEDDALGYLRETAEERLLILATRGPWSGRVLPQSMGQPTNVYGNAVLGADLTVTTPGPSVQVWRLG